MTETTHSTTPAIAASLPEIAVIDRDGEPRAHDADIAERLGYGRPRKVRELIERHRGELERFGPITPHRGAKSGPGRPEEGYLLNEEQALLVAAVSDAPNAADVRAMLIRTFVAWRRGHLEVPAAIDMRAVGGMVKGILAKQLGELLPIMVREQVAEQQHSVVRGVSAGQVLAMAGIGQRKGLRGMASWVSHRLRRFHAVRGVAVRMGSLGSSTAFVFDPLIAREWLESGGKAEIEQKASERRGQGALRLVPRPQV